MKSRKSRKKKRISNSSQSELNTTEEKLDQNASKSFDSEKDFQLHFIEGEKFEYEIDISRNPIFEVNRELSGKKYRYKVKKGWSSALSAKVWEKFKSDCSWSFKRADVVAKEVIATGKCSFKDCNAKIHVQTCNNLSKMTVKINDFNDKIKHDGNKRRQVTGTQKDEIDKMLETQVASKVHSNLVKHIMKAGDIEPAHLPSKNALNVRRHRNRLKDYDNDPYYSLSKMREYEFKKTIQFIGFNPFSVIYSTPLQRKWYRTQTIDNRRIVKIDASGMHIKAPKGSRISEKKTAKSNQSKHQSIFLYVIMQRGILNVPVGAMLSQDHTMRFITFWLSTWSFNSKIPDEIILDQSAALFGACVQTFTSFKNTNTYISACMDSLLKNTPIPPIYLRIDRYHFVCTIHRIKLFKKMDPLKVTLYKAIFGALLLCDNLEAVKKIIIDLFTIMRYRYITKTCETSLVDLQALCGTHEIFVEKEEEEKSDEDENEDSDMERGISLFDQSESDSYKETSSYRLVEYFSIGMNVFFQYITIVF